MTQLHARFRRVLGELEMLSHGSTQAWNPSGGHGGEPDDRVIARVLRLPRSPTHPDQPPHLRYRALWEAATSDTRRERIVRAAEEELASTRTRRTAPARVLSDGEILREKILQARGWSSEDLARSLRTTIGSVRRLRAAAGVDDFGQPVLIDGDKTQRARDLAARGMSERGIAMVLGGGKSTIRRLLGKAA